MTLLQSLLHKGMQLVLFIKFLSHDCHMITILLRLFLDILASLSEEESYSMYRLYTEVEVSMGFITERHSCEVNKCHGN